MPDTSKIEKKKMVKKPFENSSLDIELTPSYNSGVNNIKKNYEKSSEDVKEDTVQGISVESKTLKSTPKTFVRKVITSGDENGTTKILSSDGSKTIYEGRTRLKDTKEALEKNRKEVEDTQERREFNSNFFNVNSGSKQNLNDKDKKILVKIGKAVIK